MRLIDADALIERLDERKRKEPGIRNITDILNVQAFIDSQPTAYDIEKYEAYINAIEIVKQVCMTIDEAIAMMHEWADYECYNEEQIQASEAFNQIAEWLEELKAIKSDGFTDDLLNMGFTKGYNKAIDDFFGKLIKISDTLSIGNETTRNYLILHFNEIAEQLKAGGNDENT